MNIDLTKAERKYLEATGLVASFPHKFSTVEENTCSLEVEAEIADDIRNLCADRLQVIGFDRFYQPTQEGLMLEVLIDKFFTG